MKLNIPDKFGDYRRLYSLGKGVMGEAFLAEKMGRGEDERVAIKVYYPSVSKKLKAANKLLSRAPDSRLAQYIEIEAGYEFECFAIMHYFNLRPSYRKSFKDKTLEDIVAFYAGAAEAVSKLHESGIIHGNLKPENIQARKVGNKLEPLIVDIGFRYLYDEAYFDWEMLEKILPYMAPEVINGFLDKTSKKALPATAESDVYSLTVSLCHTLTGLVPYVQDNEASIDDVLAAKERCRYRVIIKNDPTTVLDVKLLNETIEQCCRFDPSARIGSMAELAEKLRQCVTPKETADV